MFLNVIYDNVIYEKFPTKKNFHRKLYLGNVSSLYMHEGIMRIEYFISGGSPMGRTLSSALYL